MNTVYLFQDFVSGSCKQIGNQWRTQVRIPSKSNWWTDETYWFTYRNRNDSKTGASPNPSPAQFRKARSLESIAQPGKLSRLDTDVSKSLSWSKLHVGILVDMPRRLSEWKSSRWPNLEGMSLSSHHSFITCPGTEGSSRSCHF